MSANLSASGTPAPVSYTALAIMLAALSMLGPFCVDTYLPAFPQIEVSLRASALQMQQTLSAYMFAFAMMGLWHGPLSDTFGRRKVILVALFIFSLSSIACALATSIEQLWFFRILQGLSSGAGTVIGRAIVRDVYDGPRATKLMSLTTMIFSIAPAIAPIIGGWIISISNWRTIFITISVYTILLLIYCYKALPETLPRHARQPLSPKQTVRNLYDIFSNPKFSLIALSIALNFSGFFLYVASAPAFITRHLHLGPTDFGWLFVPAVSGMFLGSLAANRMAGKIPLSKQVLLGYTLMLLSAASNVAFHIWYPPALPWSVLPLLVYNTGTSILMPAATLIVLDLFPNMRGSAASCQSFTLTMLAALVSGLVAPFLSGAVLYMACGQFALALLSLTLWRRARR